jgi:hypothetical protein
MAKPQKVTDTTESGDVITPDVTTPVKARKSNYRLRRAEDGTVVKFRFEDLEGTLIVEESIDTRELPTESVEWLVKHGIRQKVGDTTAGEENVSAAVANVQEAIKRLLAGDLTSHRESSGPKTTDLSEALHRATKQPLERCIEVIASMTKEQKLDLRKSPRIAVELKKIELERAEAAAANAGEVAPLPL